MPKFDYVQIGTELSYVTLDKSKFDITVAEGTDDSPDKFTRMKLNARTRREISRKTNIPMDKMKVDVTGPYVTIGISAKILGVDYPELITPETLEKCFANFVKYGLLDDIDIKSVINWGKLTAVELTKDYQFDTAPTNKDFDVLSKLVANPFRWNPRIHHNQGGGVGLSLMKIMERGTEFLSVYDKFNERERKSSEKFNNAYGNPFKKGSVRGEAKLLSAKSIRKKFGTNSLHDVINSTREPLQTLFQNLFINEDNLDYNRKTNKVREENLRFASLYGNDSEMIARAISKDPSQKHNRIRRFRSIMEAVLTADTESKRSLEFLKELKNFN